MPVESPDLSGKDLLVDANLQISLALYSRTAWCLLSSNASCSPAIRSRSSISERRYCLTHGVVASASSSRNRAAVWKGSTVDSLVTSFSFSESVMCRATLPALRSSRLGPMTSLSTSSQFPPLSHDFNHFIVKRDALKAFPVAQSGLPNGSYRFCYRVRLKEQPAAAKPSPTRATPNKTSVEGSGTPATKDSIASLMIRSAAEVGCIPSQKRYCDGSQAVN